MRYRQLGSTGLMVSAIGIGTWQWGGEWGRDYQQPEVDVMLDKGGELGVNLIDTAECYGDHLSEKLIGDYLARHERQRWFVATKFGHQYNSFMNRTEQFSAASVQEQLHASLRALRAERIDLYQFHSGTDALFDNEELWALLAREKAAGKIRSLGVSILGLGSEHQARRAREVGAEVLQVVYNRLDRRPEECYFPHAHRDRLGVLARVPLASGLLTGKYSPGVEFQSTDVRATFSREKMGADLQAVMGLRDTEVPPGVPMSRWALAWCLKHPTVSAVIPGCRNLDQVVENAAAADLALEHNV